MRQALLWLMRSSLVLLACGCGSSTAVRLGHGAREYRDPGGWAIGVPRGWHLRRFSVASGRTATAGAEVSNVRLPAPTSVPGYPIQVSGRVLPARGVALIIARDRYPGRSQGALAVPPLPAPRQRNKDWLVGSAMSGEPYIEVLWFKANGATFIASVKVGPAATGAALSALDGIIRSLRVEPGRG